MVYTWRLTQVTVIIIKNIIHLKTLIILWLLATRLHSPCEPNATWSDGQSSRNQKRTDKTWFLITSRCDFELLFVPLGEFGSTKQRLESSRGLNQAKAWIADCSFGGVWQHEAKAWIADGFHFIHLFIFWMSQSSRQQLHCTGLCSKQVKAMAEQLRLIWVLWASFQHLSAFWTVVHNPASVLCGVAVEITWEILLSPWIICVAHPLLKLTGNRCAVLCTRCAFVWLGSPWFRIELISLCSFHWEFFSSLFENMKNRNCKVRFHLLVQSNCWMSSRCFYSTSGILVLQLIYMIQQKLF